MLKLLLGENMLPSLFGKGIIVDLVDLFSHTILFICIIPITPNLPLEKGSLLNKKKVFYRLPYIQVSNDKVPIAKECSFCM